MTYRELPRFPPWCLLALALWYCADCSAAQDPRLTAAIAAIGTTIQKSGADVAVALRTLDGKTEWLLRADEPFHAASTMKVAVLIELYHEVRQGRVRQGGEFEHSAVR